MTKSELVQDVVEKTGLSSSQARTAIDATFEAVTRALGSDGRVMVSGFGTFEVRERKERTGLNPQTKKPITIPARRVVSFRPSKQLKDEFEGSPKK